MEGVKLDEIKVSELKKPIMPSSKLNNPKVIGSE
jgi:hypothetical protein